MSQQVKQMEALAAERVAKSHPCSSTRHSFQFYFGQPCKFCGRDERQIQLLHDLAEADNFYAELKARLDERAPA